MQLERQCRAGETRLFLLLWPDSPQRSDSLIPYEIVQQTTMATPECHAVLCLIKHPCLEKYPLVMGMRTERKTNALLCMFIAKKMRHGLSSVQYRFWFINDDTFIKDNVVRMCILFFISCFILKSVFSPVWCWFRLLFVPVFPPWWLPKFVLPVSHSLVYLNLVKKCLCCCSVQILSCSLFDSLLCLIGLYFDFVFVLFS